MVDMTASALLQITKEMKQYQTPELNDKLYLHFKGWKKIEPCIGVYTGVKALWLEGNGLPELDHLEALSELRCLYIQQNCLRTLKGLDSNILLDSLNATNNAIDTISDISHLTRLHTLQIANNRLTKVEDIAHLKECPSIGVLDLQNNKLEDPAVLDVLAAMPDLRVLQMQGNPVTRMIKHYRKTVIARCQQLTYLDDRPVFEDERRTTCAWARGGAGHKVAEGQELTASLIAEAFADETFNTEAAHAAEKAERKAIKEEKEAEDKKNRDAFNHLITSARVRRIATILPNVRLFEGLGEDVIMELAHRIAAYPVHENIVCGFAKEETCLSAGSAVQGLYFITKGKVQFSRQGKPCFDGATLQSGQYFGEPSLCMSSDLPASCDVVCREYTDVYLLSKEELLEVADMYEGTMDVLEKNRANALCVQWYECKPWKAYEISYLTSWVIHNPEKNKEKLGPGDYKLTYPKECYGKNELAKSVPLYSDDAEEVDPSEVRVMEDHYKEQWERVQAQRAQALDEAGLTEAEFEAHRDALRQGAELGQTYKPLWEDGAVNDDDLPPLEDVDISGLTSEASNSETLCSAAPHRQSEIISSDEGILRSSTDDVSPCDTKEMTGTSKQVEEIANVKDADCPTPAQNLSPSPYVFPGRQAQTYTDMDILD